MATRRDPHLRGYPMNPSWERDHADPNWSAGAYHGLRMTLGGRQAAYGFHRLARQADLLGYGGFQGVYDEGAGRFEGGVFRHPRMGPAARPARLSAGDTAAGVENGGVRGDNRYLRQYNAASAALTGDGAGGRGFGHAPVGGSDGTLSPAEGSSTPPA
jgi:hypothetical protein